MHFKEIETKYDADNIKMSDFMKIIDGLPVRKKLMVSSYDEYFTDKDGNFVRYRHHTDRGELTTKRKTSDKNNTDRIEVNLPTIGDNVQTTTAFLGLLGYDPNFNIYKTCNIFWTGKVDLVYYIVYDAKELKEKRRFIEIEADEELEWESEEQAWEEIMKYEKMLEPLGITPQHRLRKSLFEIFQK